MYIVKEADVKIVQITSVDDGSIYGLGDDMDMYVWHNSQEHAGKWVYYCVTE